MPGVKQEVPGHVFLGGPLLHPLARRNNTLWGPLRRSREIGGRRSSTTNRAVSPMALRVARGLFRLWLVLSVLWIGGVSYALSTQARAESGQYQIRPLDPNNAADQEQIIRWLDPSGTADRDELIRTAIDLDKRFKAT